MKIYLDQGEIGDLKTLVRRRGEFLTFLQGVNITHVNGNLEISPVYMPIARWETHTKQFVLVIGYELPVIVIIMQKRWPLVRVVILKEDEDEMEG